MKLNRINTRLSEIKMTKNELATLSGFTAPGIDKMIRKNSCKRSSLLKIANVLGVDESYFYDEDDPLQVYKNTEYYSTIADQEIKYLKQKVHDKEETIRALKMALGMKKGEQE